MITATKGMIGKLFANTVSILFSFCLLLLFVPLTTNNMPHLLINIKKNRNIFFNMFYH